MSGMLRQTRSMRAMVSRMTSALLEHGMMMDRSGRSGLFAIMTSSFAEGFFSFPQTFRMVPRYQRSFFSSGADNMQCPPVQPWPWSPFCMGPLGAQSRGDNARRLGLGTVGARGTVPVMMFGQELSRWVAPSTQHVSRRCARKPKGGPAMGRPLVFAQGPGGGPWVASDQDYFSMASYTARVPLTSLATRSSALPVGLSASGTQARPSGPESPLTLSL